MKKQFQSYMRHGWLMMGALALVFLNSCAEDDGTKVDVDDPIASFQFEVSEENHLMVSFSNFSQNATSYEWAFGDGNTSTEENPTHTYEAAGSYEVTLTATNEAGVSAEKTETITLEDPNSQLTALTGGDSKTWILQREGVTLGIGPEPGNAGWWSYGGVTPHADRPCILDDEYTFTADGEFIFDSKGTIFLDGTGNGGWNDTNPDVCNEEASADWTSSSGIDMSAFKSGGDYTYTMKDGILTLSGAGVYIGLANKTNSGDLGADSNPQDELVYQVVKLVDNDDVDTLQIAMQINGAAEFWTFNLVHYDDESLIPEIPTESEPFGEDLADETPTELFNTFASTDAADVVELVPTESAVTITPGVDDPADATAAKVGQYVRGTADAYSDLKFQLDYDVQLDNFSTVSIDVYFPSSNDYSGALSQRVDIFLADASQTQNFWESWVLYTNEETTVTDEWVTFTFELGDALERTDIDLIGLKIGGENHNVDGTFYVRNFKFE